MKKHGMTRREREVTDPAQIRHILDTAKIVHLGMIDGDEPYVVPMNYGYTMENGQLCLYLHGATAGRKIDVLRANPKVFFEIDCDIQPFEGATACHYGTTYASVMGRGTAELLEDMEAKKQGLSILMKTQTGKDFVFNDKMAAVVSVIRITALDYTAKRRPSPEEEKQEREAKKHG